MTTFTPSSPKPAWVCYQLLNGVARGMMSQQPITAIQANLPKDQLSIGTALVVFSQNFGASVFVSLGQTTFENSLLPALRHDARELDAGMVAHLGATGFRHVVPAASVPHVVTAYDKALTNTFVCGKLPLVPSQLLELICFSTLPLPHLAVLSFVRGAWAGRALKAETSRGWARDPPPTCETPLDTPYFPYRA